MVWPAMQTTTIRLDDFLKLSGIVATGGEAKMRIQAGQVTVNGQIETRRRKQLVAGDVIELMDQRLVVDQHVQRLSLTVALVDQRFPPFNQVDTVV